MRLTRRSPLAEPPLCVCTAESQPVSLATTGATAEPGVAAGLNSRSQVRGPRIPSTASSLSVWNVRTAAVVFGPKTPSVTPTCA